METEIMDKLESRALVYKIISQAFDYPSPDLVSTLGQQDFWDALADVFNVLDSHLSELTESSIDLIRKESEGGAQAFEIEYNRLFRLSHAEFPCAMTASEYMKGETRQALAVAQLRGLYRTFGLKMKPNREPDNVALLCEFMSWLCAKELRAKSTSNEEGREACVEAEKLVVADYLSFMPLLTKAVCHHTEFEFYRWIALISLEFIAAERKLLLPAPCTC